MTNPGSSPEPAKDGFKSLIAKGVVGAVALAGTTAIPLMVQRVLTPPTPASSSAPAQSTVSSPAPVVSPTVQSATVNPIPVDPTQTTSPQVQPTIDATTVQPTQVDDALADKGKGKKKSKKD